MATVKVRVSDKLITDWLLGGVSLPTDNTMPKDSVLIGAGWEPGMMRSVVLYFHTNELQDDGDLTPEYTQHWADEQPG